MTEYELNALQVIKSLYEQKKITDTQEHILRRAILERVCNELAKDNSV